MRHSSSSASKLAVIYYCCNLLLQQLLAGNTGVVRRVLTAVQAIPPPFACVGVVCPVPSLVAAAAAAVAATRELIRHSRSVRLSLLTVPLNSINPPPEDYHKHCTWF